MANVKRCVTIAGSDFLPGSRHQILPSSTANRREATFILWGAVGNGIVDFLESRLGR